MINANSEDWLHVARYLDGQISIVRDQLEDVSKERLEVLQERLRTLREVLSLPSVNSTGPVRPLGFETR